ncbi:MAG: hypothetical protein ACK5GN_15160 [Pseudomonadota bacterium]|jgi:hypothetical protein
MESNIIERLFASFTELETAITKARDTFKSRPTVPDAVLKRLESYDTILAKQRALAVSLCEAISRKNWDEVNRNVGLINGLSAMIRDDAKAILAAVATTEEHEQIELDENDNFC